MSDDAGSVPGSAGDADSGADPDATPHAVPTTDAEAIAAGLSTLRADPARRRLAALLGALVGLAAATVHWGGFVLGGALVALVQPSLSRGLAAGLAFGVLSAGAFLAWLAAAGALGTALEMWPVVGVAVAAPVASGLLGSFLRGVW